MILRQHILLKEGQVHSIRPDNHHIPHHEHEQGNLSIRQEAHDKDSCLHLPTKTLLNRSEQHVDPQERQYQAIAYVIVD